MFRFFEKFWLKESLFIGGMTLPSIADLSAFCEIIQLQIIQYDFSPYPKISAWIQKMISIPEIQ
jgi:glutathione S-transferase